MLAKILMTIAVIVIVFLLVASRQPADFHISRSALIAAPATAIFPHVNNLRAWNAWSPWAKMDPNAKNSFDGPPSGVGARLRWAGNHKVGEGSMTIMESRAPDLIRLQLDFLRPMKTTNVAEFTFQPQAAQTLVTWSMTGKNNIVGKAMSLIINCDKMVGGEFEKGLTSLKTVAEASPSKK